MCRVAANYFPHDYSIICQQSSYIQHSNRTSFLLIAILLEIQPKSCVSRGRILPASIDERDNAHYITYSKIVLVVDSYDHFASAAPTDGIKPPSSICANISGNVSLGWSSIFKSFLLFELSIPAVCPPFLQTWCRVIPM